MDSPHELEVGGGGRQIGWVVLAKQDEPEVGLSSVLDVKVTVEAEPTATAAEGCARRGPGAGTAMVDQTSDAVISKNAKLM